MKEFTVIVLTLAPALLCAGIAGWLAYKGLSGWGWFLFVAIVLGSKTVRYSDDDAEEGPQRTSVAGKE